MLHFILNAFNIVQARLIKRSVLFGHIFLNIIDIEKNDIINMNITDIFCAKKG